MASENPIQSRFDVGDGADHGWDAAFMIRGVTSAGSHQITALGGGDSIASNRFSDEIHYRFRSMELRFMED